MSLTIFSLIGEQSFLLLDAYKVMIFWQRGSLLYCRGIAKQVMELRTQVLSRVFNQNQLTIRLARNSNSAFNREMASCFSLFHAGLLSTNTQKYMTVILSNRQSYPIASEK